MRTYKSHTIFFQYYIMSKTNLCLGKKTETPNKCKKVKGCKVAKGTKRSFCRKAKNVSKKNATKKRRTAKRLP